MRSSIQLRGCSLLSRRRNLFFFSLLPPNYTKNLFTKGRNRHICNSAGRSRQRIADLQLWEFSPEFLFPKIINTLILQIESSFEETSLRRDGGRELLYTFCSAGSAGSIAFHTRFLFENSSQSLLMPSQLLATVFVGQGCVVQAVDTPLCPPRGTKGITH